MPQERTEAVQDEGLQCKAFWWPRTPEATAVARAEGRKVWDPIYMCGPMPGYPDCELHECDAFSCLCPFEPSHVLPVAAPLPPTPGRP